MKKAGKFSISKWLLAKFRRPMIAGLLFLTPIVVTYLVLKLLFDTIDGILQPGVTAILGRKIPGLGVIILIALVYLIGFFGSSILGRWFVKLTQRTFLKMPIVNVIYSTVKQLIESFSGSRTTGFKRVVIIEYPRAGTWTIGFLTNTVVDENGKLMALVYIPTAPTPNTGWVAIVPTEDVYDTDLPVQEALRLVLSGGIIAPPQIRKITSSQTDDLKL